MIEAHILSGGVDSMSVLWKRLVETANEVHVLHIRTEDAKGPAQLIACRKAVVWLAQNTRPFIYREVWPVRMAGKACGGSIFAQCGFALGEYIVRNPVVSTVVQGTNGGGADQAEDSLFRNRYREGVCAAVCNGYAPAPVWLYPNEVLTKAEVCRLLPAELLDLCWTCNRPTKRGDEFVPCGKCDKCEDFQKAREGL